MRTDGTPSAEAVGEGRGLRFPNVRCPGLPEPGCKLVQGVAVEVLLAKWYPVIGHATYFARPGGPSFVGLLPRQREATQNE